jgi:DNA-binding CsgD family transcriptional regulator
LPELDKIQDGGEGLSRRDRFNAPEEPINQIFSSLTTRIGHSTVGVAMFNKLFCCEALNGAFARINGAPPRSHIGRALRELFGMDASRLEPSFESVWATGTSLSCFDWTARLPAGLHPSHWQVNLYPINDASGQIRLVAATFSEVTKASRAERQLDRLTDRFQTDSLDEACLFGEEFAELSARTLDLVRRSVELIKTSNSLRCYISETRMETGLESVDLFLCGGRALELTWYDLAGMEAVPEVSPVPESPFEGEVHPHSPSPRERQILLLLADGKSNKEIGFALEISARTVECYRARIMVKLNLHSTAALVRYAIRNNIVDA